MKSKRDLTVALAALGAPTVFALFYFVLIPQPTVSRVLYFLSRGWLVLFPVLWHMLGDKQKFPFPRFTLRGLGQGIKAGMAIGLAMLVLYINIFNHLLDFTMVKQKAAQLGFGADMYYYFGFFLITMNSSLEEYYWRWFGLTRLKKVFRPLAAILLSGAGFALHHVVVMVVFFGWGYGMLFGFGVAVGGWIMAYLYHRHDSIWPSWFFHAILDLAIILIGFDMLFCS